MRKTTTPVPPEGVIAARAADYKAAVVREQRRVTSYDVAIVAGVSQSAVSRCFKPGASVSASTCARVMAAAAGLEYIPNAAARSLATRRSNVVAVVVAHAAGADGPDALAALSRQLARRGKRVLLFPVAQDGDIAPVLGELWQHQVDGAIVAADLSGEQADGFARRQLPLVLFNRPAPPGRAVGSVQCDRYESGRLLATRLAAAGHRQFGIVAGPSTSTPAAERRQGVCDRLRELGLPRPAVVYGQPGYAGGADGLRAIVGQLGKAPDAVLCGNDVMALGCVDLARHALGIGVPAAMSVASLDAIAPAGWLDGHLTTLRQPVHDMALAAAELLASIVDSQGTRIIGKRMFAAQLAAGATARLMLPGNTSLAA